MRFLYYDSVTLIEKEKSITGIKTFTLSEEFLRGHFSKIAYVPGVIFIEAMAQLLGWLIIHSHEFKLSAIMSLVENTNIPFRLRPGFKAEIQGEIISTTKNDSLGKARILVDGKTIASMDRIIYSHFHNVNSENLKKLFSYYGGLKNS